MVVVEAMNKGMEQLVEVPGALPQGAPVPGSSPPMQYPGDGNTWVRDPRLRRGETKFTGWVRDPTGSGGFFSAQLSLVVVAMAASGYYRVELDACLDIDEVAPWMVAAS